MHADAHLFHGGLQDGAGLRIELLVHQVVAAMNHVHLHAEVLQSARRFQPQQTAADDSSAARPVGILGDLAAIVQRPKDKHAGLVCPSGMRHAFNRRNVGAAAGGDDQLVIRLDGAVRRRSTHFALRRIDSA